MMNYQYQNNYQSNYQNPFQNMQNNNQIQQDERIWVANEQCAESFLVAPGSFVRLWDSQKPYFYEKRADHTGRPLPMDVFEYKRKVNDVETNNTDYSKELENLSIRIAAIEKELSAYAKSNADDTDV